MPEFTHYRPGMFCWVDLMSKDMNAAKSFYSGLFGWDVVDMDTQGGPAYAGFMKDGKQVGGLGQMSGDMANAGMPAMWNSYVSTDDVAETCRKVEAAGGTVAMPPMKILDAGHMAVVQDPTGGHVSLWQPGSHFGCQLANEDNTWGWGELMTRDADVAKKFYADVFGWTYENNPDSPGQYWMTKVGDRSNSGLMLMDESMEGVPPHWSLYFMTSDAAAMAEKIKSLGGSVMHGPFDTPVGPIVIAADTDGASFNLIQYESDTMPIDQPPA